MRFLVVVLILASFLQTTFLPINLVLMILVLRSYIRVDEQNLILAFSFGLLVSLLDQGRLGVSSLIYLALVQLTHLLTKTPLSKNTLGVIPLILIMLGIDYLITSAVIGQTLQFMPGRIIIEALISLPIYIMLRLWEERFIVRSDIKLKI